MSPHPAEQPRDWTLKHRYLEILLVLLVLSISMLMWRHSVQDPLLLHLYYIPVVLTGFYLGGYRARIATFLCIVTAFSLFVPNFMGSSSGGIPLFTLLAFVLWSATLLLVALLTGMLSDGLRKAMDETESTLKKDALTDALTGAANRRAFDKEVARRLSEVMCPEHNLALILIDIDFFKNFNDRYGHQTGDAILKQVAQVFQKVTRDTDLMARYGGEEFGVVLPNIATQDALQIAERTRLLIEGNRFDHQGLVHRLSVSVGVAFANCEDDEQTFCERADAALYSSKEAGRNCVHHHDGETCRRFGGGGFQSTQPSADVQRQVSPEANAFSDYSTGLPTQQVFVEEVRRRVLEKQRYGVSVSIALIEIADYPEAVESDVNMRKSVSATSARMITSIVRDSDFVGNWCEGTFCVLLPSTNVQQALVPISRLIRAAEQYTDPQYPTHSYRMSIGVVEVGFSDQYGDTLQRAKDTLGEARTAPTGSFAMHDGLESKLVDASEESIFECCGSL